MIKINKELIIEMIRDAMEDNPYIAYGETNFKNVIRLITSYKEIYSIENLYNIFSKIEISKIIDISKTIGVIEILSIDNSKGLVEIYKDGTISCTLE